MGAYAELYFDSRLMLSVKNGVPHDLLSVFSDYDRQVLSRDDFLAALPFKKLDDESEDTSDYPDYTNYFYIYQASASHIRDRLDLMGISPAKLRTAFEEGIQDYRSDLLEERGAANPALTEFREKYNREKGIQSDAGEYSFDYWLKLVKEAVSSGVGLDGHAYDRFDFLKSETFNWFNNTYGFPSLYLDFRFLLRVLLEFVPETHLVTLDYTDLAWSEYEDPDALLCQAALDFAATDYSISEKVIILTEGSSDITYLKKSLDLLYPHVSSSFSFADFSAVRQAGGVSSVITSLKVIISMSIKNRVVAIFDSDSAATDAIRSLEGVNLPDNIKILKLPEIKFARNYPTVGPTGNSNLNVNGLACSTEMYLPKEILRDEHGHYFPVHWSGYIKSIALYQGEISHKREIMLRFLNLIQSIESGGSTVDDYSWENMHSIFKALFSKLAE